MFFLPFFRKFLENSWTLLVVFWVPLKSIIPQQETSGNYNCNRKFLNLARIIPQQETSGNYNGHLLCGGILRIIPQQETSGNYNKLNTLLPQPLLYHNKRLQGTTTLRRLAQDRRQLYHNKRLQGTTTKHVRQPHPGILYHNKRLQGTTTL